MQQSDVYKSQFVEAVQIILDDLNYSNTIGTNRSVFRCITFQLIKVIAPIIRKSKRYNFKNV